MNEVLVETIDIQLDKSVKTISKVAAMCLSGAIANGIVIAQNSNPSITIYNNRIEFGKCYNESFSHITGFLMPHYHIEFGNLIYYFSNSYKYSALRKHLDYKGIFAPSKPDNTQIFSLIYPRFA